MVLTFDPFREFDRLAGQMLGTGTALAGAATLAMPLDLYRSGDHFVLHCYLAGVDPGSVRIDVDQKVAEKAKPRRIAITNGSDRREVVDGSATPAPALTES